MAKRAFSRLPCAPCLAKQLEVRVAASEGRVYDAAKATLIGAAMMAGLIPKRALTPEEFQQYKEKLNDYESSSRA